MKLVILALSFVALTSAATPRMAEPRDSLLVSAAWLTQHLQDRNLVLLHVGEKPEYDARHLPGARFVNRTDVAAGGQGPDTLTLEMLPADELRTRLAALGISDDSHVVVYYGKDWVSPTTRILFTMVHAGLNNVSLLDGGMPEWIKQGGQVTDAVPPAREGKLSALKPAPIVVDADFVRTHVKTEGFAVVDARDKEFYNGTQEGGPRDHRMAGHIAGAVSVPFSEMVTSDNKLKTPQELEAVFSRAGVKPGDTVIAYCHIGQQATATMFGARTLGHSVLLYDGSFEDWARRGLPVENPSKK